MSKISYRIQQAIDELDNAPRNKLHKLSRVVQYFIKDLYYDYPYEWICRIKAIYKNFKFLLPHIINFRPWDYTFNIELFCDSLEQTAKALKNDKNHKNSVKHYKRCATAIKMIQYAYSDTILKDKSYLYLCKNNPVVYEQEEHGVRFSHTYAKNEKYYYTMFKLINARHEKRQKQAKIEAWNYINKHIEGWWS